MGGGLAWLGLAWLGGKNKEKGSSGFIGMMHFDELGFSLGEELGHALGPELGQTAQRGPRG